MAGVARRDAAHGAAGPDLCRRAERLRGSRRGRWSPATAAAGSIVVSGRETSVAGGLTRVFGWYDNEWGFSKRMLDVARLMGHR
nr:hypothetical protein [Paracoccus mutanolyticus]